MSNLSSHMRNATSRCRAIPGLTVSCSCIDGWADQVEDLVGALRAWEGFATNVPQVSDAAVSMANELLEQTYVALGGSDD